MANPEHVAIIQQGVEAWNRWRKAHPSIAPDLSKAALSGLRLDKADLHGANLTGAELRRVTFWNTQLEQADLSSAHLMFADFRDAQLGRATLRRANLRAALLIRAKLPAANLREADLAQANASYANFRGADLSEAELFLTNMVGADLRNAKLCKCHVFGVSAWGVQLDGAEQRELIITQRHEPTITVDDIEVAQFVYLLLYNTRIRKVIDTVTSKTVLILGRFTAERKAILGALRQELRKYDLLSMVFDFDQPSSRDTHETITTLARLSRFIVADITDPKSIPQELVSIVETLPSVPVQPILKVGGEPWGMYDHISRYPWVLKLHRYKSEGDLLGSLESKVIGPALSKAKKVSKRKIR